MFAHLLLSLRLCQHVDPELIDFLVGDKRVSGGNIVIVVFVSVTLGSHFIEGSRLQAGSLGLSLVI